MNVFIYFTLSRGRGTKQKIPFVQNLFIKKKATQNIKQTWSKRHTDLYRLSFHQTLGQNKMQWAPFACGPAYNHITIFFNSAKLSMR